MIDNLCHSSKIQTLTNVEIIGNSKCKYCGIIKDIFDIMEQPYEYKQDTELNNYRKLPAFNYNGTVLDNYNSLEEIFNLINPEQLSLSKLYDKLVNLIYSINESDDELINKIVNILEVYEIRFYHKKGYLLAHHIVTSDNSNLINNFIKNNIGKLDNLLTSNYIFNTNGIKIVIPGNQSLLHISTNHPQMYEKIKKLCQDNPDILGYYARDYFENRKNIKFLTAVTKTMLKIYGVDYPIDNLIVDLYEDPYLQNHLLEIIKNSKQIKPNSMHNYGHVLNNLDCINNFVLKINQKYNLDLTNKVYEISSFTAEYGANTNNNLKLHSDNSTITINWNLELDSELVGTDIVFPSMNKTVKINKSSLIIHHGKLEHYVDPLISGSRINLIIWIK